MILCDLWAAWRCQHINVRCVHGDEIIARGFRRASCLDCGKSLDRPLHDDCWWTGRPHAGATAPMVASTDDVSVLAVSADDPSGHFPSGGGSDESV